MDRGAWQATVHCGRRAGHNWVTNVYIVDVWLKLFFSLSCCSYGVEPGPSTVKIWSHNHWTAREFPGLNFLSALPTICRVSRRKLKVRHLWLDISFRMIQHLSGKSPRWQILLLHCLPPHFSLGWHLGDHRSAGDQLGNCWHLALRRERILWWHHGPSYLSLVTNFLCSLVPLFCLQSAHGLFQPLAGACSKF